jgi:alpha/beta superfamily hydrolase
MNLKTQTRIIDGAAGYLQVKIDAPTLAEGVPARGVAVIAHPHPLFGGTMDNKVVQTLARAFMQCGWHAVRFNFRGVGTSQGVYDEGRGELQDLLAVVAGARRTFGLGWVFVWCFCYQPCGTRAIAWARASEVSAGGDCGYPF